MSESKKQEGSWYEYFKIEVKKIHWQIKLCERVLMNTLQTCVKSTFHKLCHLLKRRGGEEGLENADKLTQRGWGGKPNVDNCWQECVGIQQLF